MIFFWTNWWCVTTISWDACDGWLGIWYGIPDIFTYVKFTSLQVISLWQEKCDDIWRRIYLLANIWLCIILICFSSYRGHYSSLPYGFPQHCDWDSTSGVRRNAFIRYFAQKPNIEIIASRLYNITYYIIGIVICSPVTTMSLLWPLIIIPIY